MKIAKFFVLILSPVILFNTITSNENKFDNNFQSQSVILNGINDEFNNPWLSSGWLWVDPLGDSSYSLTDNPGYLRLFTPDSGHDLYLNLDAPRMIQPVSGDFEISTRVTINPSFNYQGAGLLIWKDKDNYIRLERTLVTGIDLLYRINGTYDQIELPFVNPSVYLKFERNGNQVKASYSDDGSSWIEVSTLTFTSANLLQVGLNLINEWQDNPIWADFDFFKITSLGTPSDTCSVPFYSQNDPQWKNHPLRTTGICSPSCGTIGSCGCTLTSASMLFSYFGSPLIPPALSDCMGTNACPFYWSVGASCTTGKSNFVNKYIFSYGRLEQEINQNNRPVILGMHIKGDFNKTHWVLVTSGFGSDPSNYRMHDPWYLNGTDMSLSVRAKNYDFDWISVYSGKSICNSNSFTNGFTDESDNFLKYQSINSSINQKFQTPSLIQPINGDVLIYRVTDSKMVIQLTAISSLGTISDMKIWFDDESDADWQLFEFFVEIPYSDEVYVRVRDSNENLSEIFSASNFPTYSPPFFPSSSPFIFLPITQK